MFSKFSKVIFIQKKRPVIFVLLFLTLFSLFSSHVSLADTNEGQTSVMEHLTTGALLCSLTEEEAKMFKENGGHCFGFSCIWLYSKWLQFVHPEKATKHYNGDWFKSTITDILLNWSNCNDIEKLASLVINFQQSQSLWNEVEIEKKTNPLDTAGKKLQKEYSIASLFTLDQLKQLLKEDVIHDHKLVLIVSHNHATALFKDGNNYYYFDPNSHTGEVKTTSTDQVAELIFDANFAEYLDTHADPVKPSPLAFRMFSLGEEAVTAYPSQQEILERINPSLNYASSDYADGMTGLYIASENGCLDSVNYFLSKGVDLNLANKNGWTTLRSAASNGNLEIVKALIDKGADLNLADNDDGWTALMFAASNGNLEIVKALIDKGADLNLANKNGWTTLRSAASNGNLKIVKALIDKGADLNLADIAVFYLLGACYDRSS
ncbi:putative Ankyrin [Gammaproteobacteria bacterium]